MSQTLDYFYNFPPRLIAQEPSLKREKSKLLVLDRKKGDINHRYFFNIIDYLKSGDVLVLNNSKVFPARLFARKSSTGGEVEVFLHQKKVENSNDNIWECLLRGRVKENLELILSDKLSAKVIKDNKDGTWLLQFNLKDKKFWQEIHKIGQVPLPPYIKRTSARAIDKKRYQTVYAEDKKKGSVAAPTAGLHFTKMLLKKLESKGVIIKYVTLHVGLGTFASVKVAKIENHKMHSEYVEVPVDTIDSILKAKKRGNRIVAVGTTSCRSLEAGADSILSYYKDKGINKNPNQKNISFWTDIFIYPGYKFKIIDALVTNFHIPQSTLLMLVSAFSGKANIDKAYQEAISNNYRFFSYGDAMLIIDKLS